MKKQIKSIYLGDELVSQYGRSEEIKTTTNDYVKCLHVDSSLFKTITIKLQNHDAANTLTYKLTGFVDTFGVAETIIEADILAATTTKILEGNEYKQYSKIELSVESKVDDSHAQYSWEFFATKTISKVETASATIEAILTTIDTAIDSVDSKTSNISDLDCMIGKSSGTDGDFTVAYLGIDTLTLGTFPDTTPPEAIDIERIRVFDNTGTLIEEFGANDLTLSEAAGVLTVTGFTNDFLTTDEFVIFTNVPRINLDADGDVQVDVKSSALPTGASTEATLEAARVLLAAIDTANGTITDAPAIDGSRQSQLEYIAVATEAARALLATIDADTSNLDVALSTVNTAIAAVETDVEAGNTVDGGIDDASLVNGSRQAQLRYIGVAAEAARALLATIDLDTSNLDVALSTVNTAIGIVNTTLNSPAQAGEAASATSALALEAGGNLAGVKTNTDKLDVNLSTVATQTTSLNIDKKSSNVKDMNCMIGKSSGAGADFTVAYLGITTLTLGTYPDGSAPAAIDIERIRVIDNTGDLVEELGQNELTLAVSGTTLTVTGFDNDFLTTDQYVIFTNVPRLHAYDEGYDLTKIAEQEPAWRHYTDFAPLVSAQDLTGSEVNYGNSISMDTYNTLTLKIDKDCNDSEDVDLYVYGQDEAAGDVYEVDGIEVKRLWSGTGTDGFSMYQIKTDNGVPFLQLKAKAGTVGATAGDLTIEVRKSWS